MNCPIYFILKRTYIINSQSYRVLKRPIKYLHLQNHTQKEDGYTKSPAKYKNLNGKTTNLPYSRFKREINQQICMTYMTLISYTIPQNTSYLYIRYRCYIYISSKYISVAIAKCIGETVPKYFPWMHSCIFR